MQHIDNSNKRIAEIVKSYRLCGNDLDITIEDCLSYIEHDLKWRDESIELQILNSLLSAEYCLGKRKRILLEITNRESQ